ncbi:hypothetical protein H9L13_12550 [Sphingomonas lutea]|uniref:Calcineurin-like phosphoesterase domain-containing protein n=1 Tax=Sphingomonas lutea TaxID=1045317 RepID=A0A7G9SHS5_9SPHN|nr:hypothetical protein [Sphingomonas lutea]QNN67400.1 hypothetical protein H9L13_12550 [Sphingomonas lutea]
MFKAVLTAFAALLVAGCVAPMPLPPRNLSGLVQPAQPVSDGVLVGFVADSQFQTLRNLALVRGYRGRLEDWAIPVSIRPPALDWASRALLRSSLQTLRSRKVSAVFYLGDGANNGCLDELAAGLPGYPARHERGLLAELDDFRRAANIPVYFVLGNHDLLGAGSTSDPARRQAFCADQDGGDNRLLYKSEVIALADQFNRQNDTLTQAWVYRSNYVAGETERRCRTGGRPEHRTWGCYLAATVDHRHRSTPIQFLLLDTADWANTFRARIRGFEQLGIWGGVSVGADDNGVPSQMGWFKQTTANDVPMRVALTHYDLPSLTKKAGPFGKLSSLDWNLADLFTTRGEPRIARQIAGFWISAHTQNTRHSVQSEYFDVGCLRRSCGEARQRLFVTELNIGSTTDHSNYGTIAEFRPSASGPGEIRFDRVDVEPHGCDDVYRLVATTKFPNAVQGTTSGWAALGISFTDRHNYWRFDHAEAKRIWANLDKLAASDVHRAACIGRLAAQVEAGRGK